MKPKFYTFRKLTGTTLKGIAYMMIFTCLISIGKNNDSFQAVFDDNNPYSISNFLWSMSPGFVGIILMLFGYLISPRKTNHNPIKG